VIASRPVSRVAAFVDGPGRIAVLFVIVLLFARIFLD